MMQFDMLIYVYIYCTKFLTKLPNVSIIFNYLPGNMIMIELLYFESSLNQNFLFINTSFIMFINTIKIENHLI